MKKVFFFHITPPCYPFIKKNLHTASPVKSITLNLYPLTGTELPLRGKS
jgi:hypothetical protein